MSINQNVIILSIKKWMENKPLQNMSSITKHIRKRATACKHLLECLPSVPYCHPP